MGKTDRPRRRSCGAERGFRRAQATAQLDFSMACARSVDLVHSPWPKEQRMSQSLSFSVILEPQEDGGFTVLVPALPEVVTEGDTEEEALANAREAIEAILEYRRAQGL